MIITPARFEDEMRQIINSTETKSQKALKSIVLMLDVLDSLGYEKGTALFKGQDNDH